MKTNIDWEELIAGTVFFLFTGFLFYIVYNHVILSAVAFGLNKLNYFQCLGVVALINYIKSTKKNTAE